MQTSRVQTCRMQTDRVQTDRANPDSPDADRENPARHTHNAYRESLDGQIANIVSMEFGGYETTESGSELAESLLEVAFQRACKELVGGSGGEGCSAPFVGVAGAGV